MNSTNTFEQFIEAYNKADIKIKDIIDSEQIGLFVDKLLSGTESVALKPRIMVLISNRILNITNNETLLKYLETVLPDALDRKKIISEIDSFIKSLTETSTDNSIDTMDTISNEITEAEAVLNSISPLRTMSSDSDISKQENVHSSSQFDLLRKKDDSENSPRWGSD